MQALYCACSINFCVLSYIVYLIYFLQDLLKVYLLLLAFYTVLTPVQFSAAVKQKHPITRLLTAALTSEYVALLLTSVHYGLFALNGEGISAFNTLGDVMEIFAQVNMIR